MSPRCVRAMAVHRALALFADAKKAMGERKSGPVETGLTRPVATALLHVIKGGEGNGKMCTYLIRALSICNQIPPLNKELEQKIVGKQPFF